MGSFYGPAQLGQNASNTPGGVTNYNDLFNKPIQNMTGIDGNPIVISDLVLGNYILRGKYQINPSGDIIHTDDAKILTIYEDETTHQKVAKFESFNNGKYIVTSILYEEDGGYSLKEYEPYQSFTQEIIDMKQQVINMTTNNIMTALTIEEF